MSTLRDSLWHVLWSDYETEHSAAGEALYGSLARAGGQLYSVLYERNCRRAFCPTEVFHATALAPERWAVGLLQDTGERRKRRFTSGNRPDAGNGTPQMNFIPCSHHDAVASQARALQPPHTGEQQPRLCALSLT